MLLNPTPHDFVANHPRIGYLPEISHVSSFFHGKNSGGSPFFFQQKQLFQVDVHGLGAVEQLLLQHLEETQQMLRQSLKQLRPVGKRWKG